MMDWKAFITAQQLDITDAELETIQPTVDALKKSFDALAAAIPFTVEPATIFRIEPEEI